MKTTAQPLPRLPNVGEFVRHHGKLLEVREIPPPPQPPPTKHYIFEEISARTELRMNGRKLKEITTFNDFYGLESCVEAAIEEMKNYAKREKLTPTSEVEAVVIRVVTQFAATPKDRENFYDGTFTDFEQVRSHGLADEVERVVWSSKKPT